jgi:hypothetical protein
MAFCEMLRDGSTKLFQSKKMENIQVILQNFLQKIERHHFSLSGLSRETHRVWEKMSKLLNWSFGRWKKSKKFPG